MKFDAFRHWLPHAVYLELFLKRIGHFDLMLNY